MYIIAYRKGERVIRNLNKKTRLDHVAGEQTSGHKHLAGVGEALMDIFYTL